MKNLYSGCAGWYLHDLGSREVYIEKLEEEGPCWCDVHQRDAYLCLADPVKDMMLSLMR